MAKTKALNTTITFGGTPIASLTSIGEVTPASEELDATTLDSSGGYREYIQGFKDSGEIALSGYLNKGDAGQKALRDNFATGTLAEVLITFPDASTVGCQAFVKAYSVGAAEVDGLVGFGATLRVSGAVTVTAN